MNEGTDRIILVGPTPPSIGGVSTHIARLSDKLIESNRYKVEILSTNKSITVHGKIKRLLSLLNIVFSKKKAIVHLHVDSLAYITLGFLISLRHKVFLTIHNNRYPSTFKANLFKTKIRWQLLRRYHTILAVNQETLSFLMSVLPNIYHKIIPAYLPPSNINLSSISDILEAFQKGGFDFLLSGYAYRLSKFKNEDLYGVDMMIELLKKLTDNNFNCFLVLLVDFSPNPYFDTLKQRISDYNLSKRILLIDIKSGVDSVALWQTSHVYLRPTNTDGDSISVREAISVGTPVVASDCVQRPEQTILFKNRNTDDFYIKTTHALSSSIERVEIDKDVIKLYHDLYNV